MIFLSHCGAVIRVHPLGITNVCKTIHPAELLRFQSGPKCPDTLRAWLKRFLCPQQSACLWDPMLRSDMNVGGRSGSTTQIFSLRRGTERKSDACNWLVTAALLFRFTDSIHAAAEEILSVRENVFYLWSAWHWYLPWGMSWFFNLSLGEEKLTGEMKDTWASVLRGSGLSVCFFSFRIFVPQKYEA